ncbi:MAG: hypothetical protein E7606_03715 [Ruminococcaceae bacterium]|nr:hypothetical protein [Oscillospiraceae bacterium]
MYSRSSFPREPYHIPENYRGNAFHGSSTTPEPPVVLPPTQPEPIDTPIATAADIPTPAPPTEPTDELHTSEPESRTVSATPKKASPSLLSSLLPPKPKGLSGGGLLGDLGAEELLLLGVLLLLSQNESDDDILLLLLLLLFYK